MDFGNLFDGKFKLIRLLGSGGSGRVYLAENIRTKSLWAIKEIPCDSSNQRQVEREIDVLKKIRHPALPRIVDVLYDSGMIYLIEDYFEGRNVEDILHEHMLINTATAIKWALEICDIMIFLHGQAPDPIIYRDLKPSNIILTPDGSIRLIDFGSVRRYKTDSPSDTVYIGTRGYAAPEQYGLGQTSEQTDVYSFGVTMLHIITGKRPINAAAYGMGGEIVGIEYYERSEHDERAALSECSDHDRHSDSDGINVRIEHPDRDGRSERETAPTHRAIPAPIKAILSRCIEYDPANRYHNFSEIKLELKKALGEDSRGDIPNLTVQQPLGVYRCITVSVTQNHEFAFELAQRFCDNYGYKTLILDCDFESTLSESYFTSGTSNTFLNEDNSLYRAVTLVENAMSATRRINERTKPSFIDKANCISSSNNALAGFDRSPSFMLGKTGHGQLVWLNEPDPEYSCRVAEMLMHDNGLMLSRFLTEITIHADICIILTGSSVFAELNARCFQNSHYIIYPGYADVAAIKAFNKTALLAERHRGIPSDRFKYVIWEYGQIEVNHDIIRELRDESLAGAVRKSKRREGSRCGGRYSGCYAHSMERAVKKEYDEIINALGIASR